MPHHIAAFADYYAYSVPFRLRKLALVRCHPRCYLTSMKHLFYAFIIAVAALLPPSASLSQGIKGREMLGGRFGGIITTGELNDSFGHGSELEIHFTEGLGSWYGVGFSLSMHNLGRSLDREGDINYTGTDRSVKAGVYSVTVGMTTLTKISRKISFGAEAMAGLYTVTATIPSGIWEGRITRNEFGFNGGVDIYYALNDRGLSIDVGAKYHYLMSGTDPLQVLYAYTGEEGCGFTQVTLGIILFTN